MRGREAAAAPVRGAPRYGSRSAASVADAAAAKPRSRIQPTDPDSRKTGDLGGFFAPLSKFIYHSAAVPVKAARVRSVSRAQSCSVLGRGPQCQTGRSQS